MEAAKKKVTCGQNSKLRCDDEVQKPVRDKKKAAQQSCNSVLAYLHTGTKTSPEPIVRYYEKSRTKKYKPCTMPSISYIMYTEIKLLIILEIYSTVLCRF